MASKKLVARSGVTAIRRVACRLLASRSEGIEGVAAIEFAIIVPILLLMMVAVMDLGLGFYRKMQVQNAAQAGAQFAAVQSNFVASSIQNVVTSATKSSGITASPAPAQFCGCPSGTGVATVDCAAKCDDGLAAGTYVSVSAQATYNPIMNYPLVPPSVLLTAQSTVRIQ